MTVFKNKCNKKGKLKIKLYKNKINKLLKIICKMFKINLTKKNIQIVQVKEVTLFQIFMRIQKIMRQKK